jgi:hypothetical protein
VFMVHVALVGVVFYHSLTPDAAVATVRRVT